MPVARGILFDRDLGAGSLIREGHQFHARLVHHAQPRVLEEVSHHDAERKMDDSMAPPLRSSASGIAVTWSTACIPGIDHRQLHQAWVLGIIPHPLPYPHVALTAKRSVRRPPASMMIKPAWVR